MACDWYCPELLTLLEYKKEGLIMRSFFSSITDFLFSVAQLILIVDFGIVVLAFVLFILNDKTDLINIRNAGKVAKVIVYIIIGLLGIAILFGILGILVTAFAF